MVYTPTFSLFVIYCKIINLKANSKWEGQKKIKEKNHGIYSFHKKIFIIIFLVKFKYNIFNFYNWFYNLNLKYITNNIRSVPCNNFVGK